MVVDPETHAMAGRGISAGRFPDDIHPAHARQLFAFLMFVAMLLLTIRITEPYQNVRSSWNGVWVSAVARNYLRYGPWALRLGQALDFDTHPIGDLEFYTHHPPLLPLLVAGGFQFLGENEWAARLIPIFASLVSLFVLYRLAGFLSSVETGLLAACALAAMPLFTFYGRMVNHEPLALAAIVTGSFMYSKWMVSHRTFHLLSVAGCVVVGCLTAWPAYFWALFLAVFHALSFKTSRLLPVLTVGPILAAVLGIAILINFWAIQPDALGELWFVFLDRSSILRDPAEVAAAPTTPLIRQWAQAAVDRCESLLTLPVIALGLIGVCFAVSGGRRRKRRKLARVVIGSQLCAAGLHLAAFNYPALVHEYWTFYLTAPIALLAGRGAQACLSSRSGRHRRPILLLLLLVVVPPSLLHLIRLHSSEPWRILPAPASQSHLLVSDLGMRIRVLAPSGKPVLCTLPRMGPHLEFYSDRRFIYIPSAELINRLVDNSEWGGLLVWADAEVPAEALSLLDRFERSETIQLHGHKFFWTNLDSRITTGTALSTEVYQVPLPAP